MNPRPFSLEFDNLPKETNMIILGGGLNGLQLASELYFLGFTDVLVIEAGSWMETHHVFFEYGAELATKMWIDPENNDSSHWRPWVSETPNHYTSWSGLRRKVGGRSLYWHGVCIRMEPWALSEPWWPNDVINDLTKSWNQGLPLYELLENDIDLWRQFSPGMRADDPSVFSTHTLENMGYSNSEMVRGMVRHKLMEDGKVRFSAYTPLELWLDAPDGRKLPRIVSDCYAQKILLKNNRVEGVSIIDQATKRIKNVFANRIILATGTIENSRLAIQVLSDSGANESNSLKGLSDHIVQGFMVKIPRQKVDPAEFSKMQPGPLFLVKRNPLSKSNLFAQFSLDINGDLILDSWSMGEQIPSDENYVKCKPETTMPWPTTVKAVLTKEDLNVINRQNDDLQDLWDNFCKFIGYEFSPKIDFVEFSNPKISLQNVVINPPVNADYYKPTSYASYLGTVDHEGCTLAFNNHIDSYNQFLRIPGLYAIGPCTFPRLGAANPGLSSLALVRRLAHKIAG